ncbi:MAG TPA: hypothetical protein VGN95_16975 [Pyrinomonadaceae bacterium]|nr:hypothetical protein [Pyrinomonadaceae bacterium]
MGKLTLTAAFERYGATPINTRWSCSEIAADGSLVLSGWDHLKKYVGDRLRYEDRLSRLSNNHWGRERLRRHIAQAVASNLPVRLIIATADDAAAIETEADASKVPKTFSVHDDVIGKVISFDGDSFVIEFHEA